MSAVPGKTTPVVGARQFEVDDSLDSVFDYFDAACEKGWTDGLPIYPPTASRVAAMLRYTDRGRHDVVASIPPLNGAATVEKIAINAVMAGCKPAYFPAVVADAIKTDDVDASTNCGTRYSTAASSKWMLPVTLTSK
jgi:hypothetical protein